MSIPKIINVYDPPNFFIDVTMEDAPKAILFAVAVGARYSSGDTLIGGWEVKPIECRPAALILHAEPANDKYGKSRRPNIMPKGCPLPAPLAGNEVVALVLAWIKQEGYGSGIRVSDGRGIGSYDCCFAVEPIEFDWSK